MVMSPPKAIVQKIEVSASSPTSVLETSRHHSDPGRARSRSRTTTYALRNCPARKPQRLAATIRGTKPSTACQALPRSQPGAAGAESTTRNVTDAINCLLYTSDAADEEDSV